METREHPAYSSGLSFTRKRWSVWVEVCKSEGALWRSVTFLFISGIGNSRQKGKKHI
jgi:hypothetical protein